MAGLLIDSALQESLEILVGKHRDVNPMAHCRTTVVGMQIAGERNAAGGNACRRELSMLMSHTRPLPERALQQI
jgi:hypothetical protein